MWAAKSLPCGSQGMHRDAGGFNSCTMHGVGMATESWNRELASLCCSSLGKGDPQLSESRVWVGKAGGG